MRLEKIPTRDAWDDAYYGVIEVEAKRLAPNDEIVTGGPSLECVGCGTSDSLIRSPSSERAVCLTCFEINSKRVPRSEKRKAKREKFGTKKLW